MNENGCKSLRPRQKGLLSGKDRKRRVHFARNALKQYDPEFWAKDVLLYLDGVSFVHKHNPQPLIVPDRTIATMHDRLRIIAKNGGYRTKY